MRPVAVRIDGRALEAVRNLAKAETEKTFINVTVGDVVRLAVNRLIADVEANGGRLPQLEEIAR